MHHVMHDRGLPQPLLIRIIALQFLAAVGTRMSKFNWRSASGYDRAQGAEITGFAWECLRRNQNYQRDRRGISPTSTVSDEFRQRWGLCFRS
jgi:Family of unknown function (DUF6499)